MQKNLIALAVAGLVSTGAFAQANVTVYGVADGSFDVVRVSNTAGNAAGDNDLGNTTRVSTNSSLIGFKGAEALGNGLTAVFQYESSVGFDNTGGIGATRDSFVGVAGGFGTVVLGNLTGPTRALGGAVDVNAGATGIGANAALLGKLGGYLVNTTDLAGSYPGAAPNTTTNCGRSSTCTSIFDTRWKNAIAYVSPSFAGLSVTAAYVANENKAFQGASAANTTGYDVGLKYANGPAMAAVTYNAVSLGQTFAGGSKQADVSDFRVGGSYDFGIASVRALFDHARADHAGIGGKITQNVFGLGGTFNVTPAGKLLAQVYLARDLKVDGSDAKDSGAKLFEVGYEHSLSKRTMLKAVYAHLNNDNKASYDFGINAVGINAASMGAPAAGLNTTGATIQGIQLGLRHSF
ncbi:MAG: porin [Zoogloea oleivorans]|jgi:predicted porin|uniref:porin n=1 Tax=Zoogloea oleivorans TaxID=1552750 RepID=UPI002A365602|nr:porin [Zoogloea oleivorans]MDY0035485.1 porin [Zoogloea oleivorans]